MRCEENHVYLKLLSWEELEGNYIQWLNDKEICKYNSHGDTLYTRDMAEAFIRSLADDVSREVYAVYLIKIGLHIGNISLQQIDLRNKQAEIAYLFGEKEHWNKGYAKNAGEILLKHAFEDLALHRIYFGTHVDNYRMRNLGEKLGFLKEGILKEAFFKDGKYNDIIIYGKLNR
jgi:RimJ/RimL family protein N-acetyltransferase